jgi:hypothetical protein
MGNEEDYSIEIGQLSDEENAEYLACCQVILSNLKRQSDHNQRARDYIRTVEKIADCHQRAF